ncbi:MAG TPA: hypothetical protein VE195_00765 [Acidobacteriaceae bacterium]|nr:hypothetical protein [Acidobacteriaceae bacterium]
MSEPPSLPNLSSPNIYGPITAGQLFERTFTLLRENFKLFFGIVLILVGVEIVFGGITASIFGANALLMSRATPGPASLGRILFLTPIMFVGGVLLFVLIQIIQGALFVATTARLANTQITVGDSCKLAADRIGKLIGISLLIILRAIGYVLLFFIGVAVVFGVIALFSGLMHAAGGNIFSRGHHASLGIIVSLLLFIAAAVIAYLLFWLWLASRYALSIPAAIAENLSVTESIRRSIHLSHGSRGRLYALFVSILVADLAIASVTVPFQLMLGQGSFGQHGMVFGGIAMLLSAFRILISAFIVAVMGVATALCYYDLRVRKEGFGIVAPTPSVPVPPSEPWPLPPSHPTGDLPIA